MPPSNNKNNNNNHLPPRQESHPSFDLELRLQSIIPDPAINGNEIDFSKLKTDKERSDLFLKTVDSSTSNNLLTFKTCFKFLLINKSQSRQVFKLQMNLPNHVYIHAQLLSGIIGGGGAGEDGNTLEISVQMKPGRPRPQQNIRQNNNNNNNNNNDNSNDVVLQPSYFDSKFTHVPFWLTVGYVPIINQTDVDEINKFGITSFFAKRVSTPTTSKSTSVDCCMLTKRLFLIKNYFFGRNCGGSNNMNNNSNNNNNNNNKNQDAAVAPTSTKRSNSNKHAPTFFVPHPPPPLTGRPGDSTFLDFNRSGLDDDDNDVKDDNENSDDDEDSTSSSRSSSSSHLIDDYSNNNTDNNNNNNTLLLNKNHHQNQNQNQTENNTINSNEKRNDDLEEEKKNHNLNKENFHNENDENDEKDEKDDDQNNNNNQKSDPTTGIPSRVGTPHHHQNKNTNNGKHRQNDDDDDDDDEKIDIGKTTKNTLDFVLAGDGATNKNVVVENRCLDEYHVDKNDAHRGTEYFKNKNSKINNNNIVVNAKKTNYNNNKLKKKPEIEIDRNLTPQSQNTNSHLNDIQNESTNSRSHKQQSSSSSSSHKENNNNNNNNKMKNQPSKAWTQSFSESFGGGKKIPNDDDVDDATEQEKEVKYNKNRQPRELLRADYHRYIVESPERDPRVRRAFIDRYAPIERNPRYLCLRSVMSQVVYPGHHRDYRPERDGVIVIVGPFRFFLTYTLLLLFAYCRPEDGYSDFASFWIALFCLYTLVSCLFWPEHGGFFVNLKHLEEIVARQKYNAQHYGTSVNSELIELLEQKRFWDYHMSRPETQLAWKRMLEEADVVERQLVAAKPVPQTYPTDYPSLAQVRYNERLWYEQVYRDHINEYGEYVPEGLDAYHGGNANYSNSNMNSNHNQHQQRPITNSSYNSSYNNNNNNNNNNNRNTNVNINNSTNTGVGGGARTQTNGGTPAPKGMASVVTRGAQKRYGNGGRASGGLPPLGPSR